jgi:hypothetical protein
MLNKIPFKIVELEKNSYHILVKGKIKNIEYLFVLDSGASKTLIDIKVAEKLKRIPVKTNTPIATGIMAEKISVELVSIPTLELNGLKFKKIDAVVTDLKAINDVYSKLTGKTIGGLIGCDFLIKQTCRIDFKKKHIVAKKSSIH